MTRSNGSVQRHPLKINYLIDVVSCPRCMQAHDSLEFQPLTNQLEDVNYWAYCPRSEQPVLAYIDEDGCGLG